MLYVEWDGVSDEVQVECLPSGANLQRLRQLRRRGLARFGSGADGRKYWFIRREGFHEFAALFAGEFVSDPKPHVILGSPAPPPPPYLAALDTSQPPNVAVPLYPYQCVGASFLEWGVRNGLPVLLADSRGLGKTAQAIGAKERLWASGVLEEGKPTLDITLASLKLQTVLEGYSVFAPHRKVAAVLGDKKRRMKVYERARRLDVVVINYELLLHDLDILKEIGFQLVWCDEPHLKIGNYNGKMHQALLELGIPLGFCTTGSPVRKNPANLYGLIHAINPCYMESPEDFERTYITHEWVGRRRIQVYRNLDKFCEATEWLVLRRTAEDVGVTLPELRMSNRYVEPTPLQQRLEEIAREHLRERRANARRKSEADALENLEKLLIWVRHAIADDPTLLMVAKSAWVQRTFGEPVADWIRAHHPDLRSLPAESLFAAARSGRLAFPNPKLDLLEEILQEEILPEKVLVFTQLKTVARAVYRRLARYGIAWYVGGMSEMQRHEQLQRFRTDPDIHVMVCTDAGGVGLNVQAAKWGINFNMPADPTVVDQRVGRNNRLGSPFKENVWANLIVLGTIDEEVLKGQRRGQLVSRYLVDADDQTRAELRRLSRGAM